MESAKVVKCPNCGANATNLSNCEYCGSLLVRFVEKKIDLSHTTYLNDVETYPGLINALKLNLQLQESTNEEGVATDIVGPVTHNDTGRDYIGCVLRNGYINFLDGSSAPSKSKKGICINFSFSSYLDRGYELFNAINEEQRKRFKTLDCYPLFIEHISFYTDELGYDRKCHEYFIDFGKDAEGASRLISKVLKDVLEIPFDANIEYYTNAGYDNIEEARRKINAEIYGTSDSDSNSNNDIWRWLVGDNSTANILAWIVSVIFILYWLLS